MEYTEQVVNEIGEMALDYITNADRWNIEQLHDFAQRCQDLRAVLVGFTISINQNIAASLTRLLQGLFNATNTRIDNFDVLNGEKTN